VAEGAQPIEGTMQTPEHDRDEYGRPRLGGISQSIAQEIQQRTGIETRPTITPSRLSRRQISGLVFGVPGGKRLPAGTV
jgi:hypothetical protein